jgi:thiosulfate reductase cytochrome b subunit
MPRAPSARFAPFAFVIPLGAIAVTAGAPVKAHADSAACLTCHQDPALNRRLADKSRNLVLDTAALKRSVHADIDCTDCHTQLADAEAGKPHATKVGPPHCAACHEEPDQVYQKSVHGRAAAKGGKGMALCGDCHGAHDIVKVKDQRSRVAKLNLPYTCAKCHKNPELSKEHGFKAPDAAKQYMESIHGRGLLKEGLIVAPGCTDCHNSHDIQRDSDPRSPINHRNVPSTCGKCHVGVNEIYEKSIHGQLLKKGDSRGPVCITCHTAHQITLPTRGVFKVASDERCGGCHKDRLARYRETYHGKAIALGQTKVAACYDCHGHHDILAVSNPASHLSTKNRLETCQRCHPRATAGFTKYVTHADHQDRKHYPELYYTYILMTFLLLGVFGFFGLHTLLWFVRSFVLMVRDPRAFREARRARKALSGVEFVRFRPVDRFCHFLVIVSFLLLVTTGMPLKFFDRPFAQWIFGWMGGAEVAAALHRLGAFITLTYFAIHLVSLLGSLWRNRFQYRNEKGRFKLRRVLGFVFGPDSPMPNWQDLKDFWAHQKWFFGRGPRPQFDRWTYWEKFDYLAVFWGVAVIGLSGLVMWFPERITATFPGWIINVSQIVHSDEALLAAGFIFTFHFFNVHFRVEKFPMDPVIFSGRISEEEMREERGRLFARLSGEGRLETERVRDEWERWKLIFIPIGMLAFIIGVVLIIAIYSAMASRLLHG